MPGADLPPHVQVLDQEAGGDHPDAVVHPAPLRSWRIPASTIGYPVRARAPRPDRVLRLVVGQPGHPVEVVPGRGGVGEEHVGVELAPGQLGLEGGRPGAPLRCGLGEQLARVQDAVLQEGREPRGPVGPGVVAQVVVRIDVAVQEGAEPSPRSVLAGRRHGVGCLAQCRVEHRLHPLVVLGLHPPDVAWGGQRIVPAVAAPGLAVGREHLVGVAGTVHHRAGSDGVRRAGGDALDVVRECLDDGPVAGPPVGSEVVGHVDLVGPDTFGHQRHHRRRPADADAQPAAHRIVERPERGREPGTTHGPGTAPQRGIQHEQPEHRLRARPPGAGQGGRAAAGPGGTT